MTRFISPFALAAALSLPFAAEAAPTQMPRPDVQANAVAGADLLFVKDKDKKKGKKKAKLKKKKKKDKSKDKGKVKAKIDIKDDKAKIEIKDGKDKAKIEVKDGKSKVEIDGDADFARRALSQIAGLGVPLAVLGTSGLSDILIDCPPGLAGKDVPCVPPGQAKKSVTAEDWASRNDEDVHLHLIERQRDIDREIEREYDLDIEVEDGADLDPFVNDFALTQERIVEIFALDPAPENHAYIIIDGQPVLLDMENYRRIRLLRGLQDVQVFDVEDLDLTSLAGHDRLLATYDLPEPEPDHYYAAVDGEVLLMPLRAYEMIQLLRIAAIAPSSLVAQGG
ncbi:hypothetical protein MALG_01965 [Marinovum algicola DG 898]|nr:hypothetical protein MALG_01965 [Marinovum algicola DG 898]